MFNLHNGVFILHHYGGLHNLWDGLSNFDRKTKRLYASLSLLALTLMVSIIPAFATDPLAAVNNLSNFIFSLIRAIGVILLGFGILQMGLSFKSHDPSQRANGMLTVAGGLIIVFTKEILNLITG